MNLQLTRELPNPDAIKALLPTTPELQAIKARRDEELKAILSGRDRRFLLIIGPYEYGAFNEYLISRNAMNTIFILF